MEIFISETLKVQFPNIKVGIIEIKKIYNKISDTNFEKAKLSLESHIRQNYTDVKNFEVIRKNNQYFKNFYSTYPILFQIQSILKGKSFPSTSCAVEAMFMAELESMFLTAGHDLDTIEGDLNVTLTKGEELYIKINKKNQSLKPNDIICFDGEGIISSVLYGPDFRTKITQSTSNCLFFSYFPYGEDDSKIQDHFNNILKYIKLFSDNVLDLSEIKIVQ